MPIYEYSCQSCGKLVDVLQKLSDPPPAKCESCGAEGTMSKVVSRSSFVLKGGGWYSDLYSSAKKDGGASATSTAEAGAAKESSSSASGTASATTSSGTSSTASTSSGSSDKK